MFGMGNKCRRIRRLLSDRVDAPLPARAERKVAAHLENCPECRDEYAFYQELKENATHLQNSPPPAYLWERISLAVDEHPWGEDEGFSDESSRPAAIGLTGKINWAAAILSIALVAVLSLSPGGVPHESRLTHGTGMPGSASRDIEYVSLYLMANQDKFPEPVRDYYIGHMEGLNQKIETIKSALERYPQNNHIKAQLAMAYRQKIELYKEMGMAGVRGGGSIRFEGAAGEDFFRGRHYE